MKVKKNDTVKVITGKDAGKTGKVLVALPKEGKVVVEGVNIQKKHKKARNAQDVSKIQEQNGAIEVSNVMVVCPKCGKATRVGYKVEGDKKVRVCKHSGCNAVLDVAETKEVKKASKKSASTEKSAEKKTATKTATKKTAAKKAATAEAGEEKKTVTKKATAAKKTVTAKKAKAEDAGKAE